MDLYDLSEWEPRTVFDRICVYFSRGSGALITAGFALSAVLLLCITVASFLFSPLFGAFTLLSLVPALFFVAYIWDTDPYEKLPAGLILVTFLLCGLLVAVPLGVNTATVGFFGKLTGGMAVFFFLVVAPVEETVKLLAVRLYGYDKDVFDSAADGAVLGAVAGLAFAMVENGVYISGLGLLGAGGMKELTIGRAAVAPLHVFWSTIAGYYLALAKLNKKHAKAIVFKGLLIAGILHGTYNTFMIYAPYLSELLEIRAIGVENTRRILMTVFLLGFYGSVGYYSVSKLDRHREYTVNQRETEDVRTTMEMSDEEIDEFLISNGTGVLAFGDENEAYAIPVSYGYSPEDRFLCIVLGFAPRSEKRRWVRNTERVSFDVYEMHEDLSAESVIIRGGLEALTEDETEAGYTALSNNALFTALHFSGAPLEKTDIDMYRLRVDEISGRRFRHDISAEEPV